MILYMSYLLNLNENVIDNKLLEKIILNMINYNYGFRYTYYGNFEQNRLIISEIILKTINKFKNYETIELSTKDFYTIKPALAFRVIDKLNKKISDIVVTNDRLINMNDFYKDNHKNASYNSIVITNLITGILQYDFNVKYAFKDFEKNMDKIKIELIKRINLNHNIKSDEFHPKEKLKNSGI